MGTFVDVGNQITQYVLQSVRTFVSRGNQCYLLTSSVSEIFPQVSLNFAQGASMMLNPQDYLLQQNSISKFPTLNKIFDSCMALPEFQAFMPHRHPDAES